VDVAVTVAEKIPEALEEQGEKETLSEQLVAVGLPKNPPRELPELLSEAAKVRREFAELQQPFSALNSREKKLPAVPWLRLCATVVSLIGGGAFAWWLNSQFLWISLGAGLCSILLLSWGGWRHTLKEKASAECRKVRSRLEQQKQAAQKRQTELTDRCEALGLPSSAIDLVRVQKLVTAHRELLESWWKHVDLPVAESSVAQNISEGDSAEAATSTNMSVVNEEAEQEAEQELGQLEARMSEFRVELEQKELRLKKLQLQINEPSSDQRPSHTTSGTALHNRKLELEERITLLRKAVNLLAGAVDEFSRSHLLRLNEEASKLFGKITSGRYRAIKLDENMAPSVQIDDRRWMSVENFSRGTVDAIYLSLRVALAKVRDDGRSLPLMLDDPFVHLDQKRLATTLNLIDLASADGQLILFSHNLELGKRAARERWHVVPLDGDVVAASTDEGGEHAGQLHLL
jgi:hypothetical protein